MELAVAVLTRLITPCRAVRNAAIGAQGAVGLGLVMQLAIAAFGRRGRHGELFDVWVRKGLEVHFSKLFHYTC